MSLFDVSVKLHLSFTVRNVSLYVLYNVYSGCFRVTLKRILIPVSEEENETGGWRAVKI